MTHQATEESEILVAGTADGAAVNTGVNMDNICAHGHVYRYRYIELVGCGNEAVLIIGKVLLAEHFANSFTNSNSLFGAFVDGRVQGLTGLPGRAKGAFTQYICNFFRSTSYHGNFSIMDDAGAVECYGRDDASFHK